MIDFVRAKEVEVLVLQITNVIVFIKSFFLIIRAIINTSKTFTLLATTADIYYHVKTGI